MSIQPILSLANAILYPPEKDGKSLTFDTKVRWRERGLAGGRQPVAQGQIRPPCVYSR